MKKITISTLIITIIVSISLLVGCAKTPSANNTQKIKVAATIFPFYDFAKEIGGKYADVVLILPPGSSPHTFSPKISDIKKLAGAKAIFYNDAGLDEWAVKLAKGANVKTFVNVNSTIQNIISAHNGNPHVWLNPSLAKAECRVIANTLEELDPAHKSYYELNYQNYTKEIDTEAKALKEKLAKLQNKNFIAFHPAYTYFAEYFGLSEVAVIEKVPGQKPTPKEMLALEQLIKQHNIKVIFSEPQLHSDIVNAIAKDTGIKIATLDPLGGTDGRDSYLKLLQFDVDAIIKAMGK